jgi:hypothetical protein
MANSKKTTAKSSEPEESGARKFRVVEGKHHTRDKTYYKGEVVESEDDLTKMFPGKFEEMNATTASGKFDKAAKKNAGQTGPPRNRDEEVSETEPTLDKDDQVFDKGSTAKARPTADDEAEALEADEETRSESEESEGAEEEVSDEETETSEGEGEEEPEETSPSDLGVDVSSQFPDAKKADLVVLKKGSKFQVADKDDPSKPVSKKPMTKDETNKFLKKQVK